MARKIAFSLLGSLFLLFAYFQWNDPDSLKWILYYVLVATLAFATAFRRSRIVYISLMLGVTLVWMLTLIPDALAWIQDGMPSLVESMKASSPYIELVREFLGLGISLIAIIFMLIIEKRSKSYSKS